MKNSKAGFSPASGFFEPWCRHNIFPKFPEAAFSWTEFQPLLDSSQVSPEHWNQLIDLIKQYDQNTDAFLIIHGTDTMAYTSSALAFMTMGYRKPIVLTGSMIPVSEPNSDGPANMEYAIKTCLKKVIHPVTICFNQQQFAGEHVTKFDARRIDAFDAPTGFDFSGQPAEDSISDFVKINTNSARVSVFTFVPGSDLYALEALISNHTPAIIIQTFGMGNMPNSEALYRLLKRAKANNLLIVNISQCYRGDVDMTEYSANGDLDSLGVLSANNMTLESLTAKLLVCLSRYTDFQQRKEALITPWIKEFPRSKT